MSTPPRNNLRFPSEGSSTPTLERPSTTGTVRLTKNKFGLPPATTQQTNPSRSSTVRSRSKSRSNFLAPKNPPPTTHSIGSSSFDFQAIQSRISASSLLFKGVVPGTDDVQANMATSNFSPMYSTNNANVRNNHTNNKTQSFAIPPATTTAPQTLKRPATSSTYGQYQSLPSRSAPGGGLEALDDSRGRGVAAVHSTLSQALVAGTNAFARDLQEIELGLQAEFRGSVKGLYAVVDATKTKTGTANNKRLNTAAAATRPRMQALYDDTNDNNNDTRAQLNALLTENFTGGVEGGLELLNANGPLLDFFVRPPLKSSKPLTSATVLGEVVEPLARAVYMQKHLDLALSSIISYTSTSHSSLSLILHQIRSSYATAFQSVRDIISVPSSDSSQSVEIVESGVLPWLNSAVLCIFESYARLASAEDRWSARELHLASEGVRSRDDLRKSFEGEMEETREVRRKADREVAKMSETVKTLGGIFKSLKESGLGSTSSSSSGGGGGEEDLKILQLQRENKALRETNGLVVEAKSERLKAQIDGARGREEIERLRNELDKANKNLEEKELQIAELTEEEYQRRLELEKLKTRLDLLTAGNGNDSSSDLGDDDDDEAPPAGVTGGVSVKSTMYMARISVAGDVLWKEPMGEIDDVAKEFNRAKPNHRLLCHSFRLMLPNLRGVRPARNLSWVRRVMRGLLHAKVADDALVAALPSCGEGLLTRFPELVYGWFEPSEERMERESTQQDKDGHYVKVNDDRWGLYYGAKHLAVDDPEAHLFFAFLDESKGEDYVAFGVHCLIVAEGLAKQLLRSQFGPTIHSVEGSCQSMEILQASVQRAGLEMNSEKKNIAVDESNQQSCDFYVAGGAQGIWVPSRILEVATRVCLEKCEAEKVAGAIERTRQMGVEATDRLSPSDIVWEQNNSRWDANYYEENNNKVVENIDDHGEDSLAEMSFNDEDSLDSLGLSKKPAAEELPIPLVCNLFNWIRMILDVYEAETTMRKAAIRVMFETASTGALTDDFPLAEGEKKIARVAHPDEEKFIDLPQFIAIARTIHPNVSTSEAAACYREAYGVLFPPSQHHKPPPPGITFSSFMEAAETRQWMSKSSIVSSYISAEQTEHLPVDVAQNLRSLVHMHSEQIKPLTTIMKRTCTDRMRWKIEHVEKEIDRCLFDEFSQAGSHGLGGRVSAMRPLCAYRRLLSLLLQAKFLRHENGDGFVVKMSNRVLLLEAKKGMKESSSDLEKQVQSKAEQMARSSVNATRDVINETVVVDPYKVMAQTILELNNLRTIIMDFVPNRRIEALNLIKEGTGAVRLQRCWRRKLTRELGPPTQIRNIMRNGYIRGMGDIRSRRVYRPVWWTQSMVGELLTTYLINCQHSSQICHAPPSISKVVYRFFLNRWGCNSLAERDLHDFFLNLRNLSPNYPRCRLFAAFCKTAGANINKSHVKVCDELASDPEHDTGVFHFYIRTLLLVHQTHAKFLAVQAKKLNNNYTPSKFIWLFPTSEMANSNFKELWRVPSLVLLDVTRILFQKVYDKEGESEDRAGAISFSKLLQTIQDMAEGGERLVNVDEWTWLIVQHYSEIKLRRFEKSHNVSHGTTECGTKKVGREIATSLGRYKSHSIDWHADEEDVLDHATPKKSTRRRSKSNMGSVEEKKGESEDSDNGNSNANGNGGNKDKEDHDYHHEQYHKQLLADFEHTKLYEEALHSMQNENYTACDAVARSLHKHMMSDLDLPLPLAKIPVSNCEQVVKQLILAWHGFARPMTFLKQEILSDHEERDATDEVHLLFSELDYFAQSVKKLEKMVNFSVEEGGAGTGTGTGAGADAGAMDESGEIGNGNGARPMSAAENSMGDGLKREIQTLSTKAWLLLRHLCSNVKTTYGHEASLVAHDEHAGTKRDVLLSVDHPLRDAWSVGKPVD